MCNWLLAWLRWLLQRHGWICFPQKKLREERKKEYNLFLQQQAEIRRLKEIRSITLKVKAYKKHIDSCALSPITRLVLQVFFYRTQVWNKCFFFSFLYPPAKLSSSARAASNFRPHGHFCPQHRYTHPTSSQRASCVQERCCHSDWGSG